MKPATTEAVCVLGMHRSGTSAVADAISRLGVHWGRPEDLLPATSDNPKGFFEHKGILSLNEKLLKKLNRSWDGTLPVPAKWWEQDEIIPLREPIREFVASTFGQAGRWGWKDPRTCITLPLWQEVLAEMGHEVCYVIVARNPLDVAASLKKRDGFALEKSIALYLLHTLYALHHTRGSRRVLVCYEEFLEDPRMAIERITTKLNLPQPDEAQLAEIGEIVDPSLSHSLSSRKDVEKLDYFGVCQVDEFTRHPESIDSAAVAESVEHLLREYESFAKLIAAQTTARRLNLADLFGINGKQLLREPRQTRHLVDDGTMREYEFAVPWEEASELRFDPGSVPSVIEIAKIELWGSSWKGKSRRLVHGYQFDEIRLAQGLRQLSRGATRCLMATNADPIMVLPLHHRPKDDTLLSLKVTMAVHDIFTESTCQNLVGSIVEKDRALEQLRRETTARERAVMERLSQLERSLRPQLVDITSISSQHTSALAHIQTQMEVSAAASARNEAGIAELESQLAGTTDRVAQFRDEILSLVVQNADAAANLQAKLDALGVESSGNADAIANLQAKLDALGGEFSGNADAIANLQAKLDALGGEFSGNATAISTIQAKLDTLGAEHSGNAEAISAIQTKLDTLAAESFGKADAIGNIQAKLDALGVECSGNADAIGNVQAKLDALGLEYAGNADAIGNIQGKLEVLGSEDSKNSDAIANVEGKLDALCVESSRSADAIAHIQTKLNDVGGECSGNAEAIAHVQATLDTLDGKYSGNGEVVANIQATLESLGAEHGRNAEVIARVQAKLEGLSVEYAGIADATSGIQAKLDTVGAANCRNIDAIGNLETKLDCLQGASSRNTKLTGHIQAKLDSLSTAYSRHADLVAQIGSKLSSLCDVLPRTEAGTKKLESKLNAVVRREVELQQSVSDLLARQEARSWKLFYPLHWLDRQVYSFCAFCYRGPRGVIRRLRQGHKRKRLRPLARIIRESGWFDDAYYLLTNPDVAQAGMDPAIHFLLTGASEGRKPHPDFDPISYLRRNPEVALSGVNPLVHYVSRGAVEGRSAPSAVAPIPSVDSSAASSGGSSGPANGNGQSRSRGEQPPGPSGDTT